MEWTAVLKGHLADGKVCVCVCVPPFHNSCLLEAALWAAGDNYTARLMAKVVSLRDGSANGSPCVSFHSFKKKKRKFFPIFPADRAPHCCFSIFIYFLFFFLLKRETEERKKSWYTPQRKQAAVCLRFPSSMRHNRSVCFPVEPITIILFSDCGRVDQQSQVVLRFSVFPLALANYRRVLLNKTFCETTAAGLHLQFATTFIHGIMF